MGAYFLKEMAPGSRDLVGERGEGVVGGMAEGLSACSTRSSGSSEHLFLSLELTLLRPFLSQSGLSGAHPWECLCPCFSWAGHLLHTADISYLRVPQESGSR